MLLEELISMVAPISCYVCGEKGVGLCPKCQEAYLDFAPPRCYKCHKSTVQHQVCVSCRSSVALQHLWVVTMYEDLAKELLHILKFECSAYISKDISRIMAEILPILPPETLVCHVPTAPSRIRVRGYDQSKLIAKNLAKLKKLQYKDLINRVSNSRQLGASREKRFKQAKEAFKLKNLELIKESKVLLVDDVTTSGATLEYIAKMLKNSGAKSVDAIVFAQALD